MCVVYVCPFASFSFLFFSFSVSIISIVIIFADPHSFSGFIYVSELNEGRGKRRLERKNCHEVTKAKQVIVVNQ